MPITPEQRAAKVQQAIVSLADSVEKAAHTLEIFGPSHAATLAAWEDVEKDGATVHRQSRLLAGKSKGG